MGERANAIYRDAAGWAAKGGELSAEERALLEAWLAEDRRHLGAYLRARAVLHLVEKHALALQTNFSIT